MADQITNLYNVARQKGVLAEGLTEDMFREQTSTEEGLRSFYDYATDNGMKLDKWDNFYTGYLRATGKEAQPSQPAQTLNPSVKDNPTFEDPNAQKPHIWDIITDKRSLSTNPGMRAAAVEDATRKAQREQEIKREQSATMPLSEQDLQYGMFDWTGKRGQAPSYLTRKENTMDDVLQNVEEAWNTNRESGKQARAEFEQGRDNLMKELQDVFDATDTGKEINKRYSDEYQKAFDAVYGKRFDQDTKRLLTQYQTAFDQSIEANQILAQFQSGKLTADQANAKLNEEFQRQYGQKYQQAANDLLKQYQQEFDATDKAKNINTRHNDEYSKAFEKDMSESYETQMAPIVKAYNDKMYAENGDYIRKRERELGQTATASNVDDWKKRYDYELKSAYDIWQTNEKELGRLPISMGSDTPEQRQKRNELTSLVPESRRNYEIAHAAEGLIKDTEDLMDAVKKGKSFGGGFVDGVTDINTWDFGLGDVIKMYHLSDIVKKQERYDKSHKEEDRLTEHEQMLLDASAIYAMSQLYYAELVSRGYKAGQSTAVSIPYMLEFAAMPIENITNSVARGVLKYGAMRFGRKFIPYSLRKSAALGAGKLVAAGVQTATFGGGHIASDYMRRTTGSLQAEIGEDGRIRYAGIDPRSKQASGQALRNAVLQEYNQNLGEIILGTFAPIKKTRMVRDMFKGIEHSELGRVLNGIEKSQFGRITKRTQWNGVLAEDVEENITNLLNWGFTTDYTKDAEGLQKAGFNLDNQIDTFLALAPTSVFFGVVNTGSYYVPILVDSVKLRKKLQTDAEKRMFDRILSESRSGDFGEKAHDLVRSVITDSSYSQEAKWAMLQQIYSDYQQEVTKQAEQANVQQVQQAEPTPEDKQAIIRQRAASDARKEIEGIAHEDGNVYRVGIKGRDDVMGYAFRGNLNIEQGEDELKARGRDLVTVKLADEDHTVLQVPADELTILDAPASAQDRLQTVTDHLFAKYANEEVFHVGDKVTIKQNGQVAPYTSTITAIDDAGVHVEVNDGQGGVMDMPIPHETAAEQLAVVEGEQEEHLVTYNFPGIGEQQLRQTADGMYETVEPDERGEMHVFNDEDLATIGATRVGEQPTETSAEVQQPEVTPQPQAPSYPQDENGNPAWNQIEQGQAAQILYDLFGSNRQSAQSYAEDMLKEAQKVQKQAAKQTSHNLNIAERIAEDEQNKQFRAQADAAVKYWEQVKLSLNQIKTAEEQAAAEAQRQAMLQAREERSKTETGTVTSANMAERYEAAPKIIGNAGTTTLPDGRELAGNYVLIAPEGVTPSHDVTKNFRRSEGYPVTSNGQSINDRDYTNDKEEQQKVATIAQNFNGNAIKNMPVISDEGLVYNGNGRMMAGQLAALNGTDAAYTQSLMNNAAQYGFTPEQVASIPNARVVFQLDERLPYSTQSLAIFNEQETQTQSNTGKAAGYARKLTPQAISEVLAAVDGFNTIDAFFNDPKAPHTLINNLINTGIIAQREKAEMVDGDKLSATGRERLSNILFGTVFDNETIRLMGDDAALKNSILRALPQILDNKSLGEFSLEADINDAIRLLYEVRKAKMPFRSFVSQTVIAEDGQTHTAAEDYSPYQLLLAEEMTEGGVDAFRDVLTLYNDEARMVIGGQADIFGNLMNDTELKNLILQRYGKEQTETERPNAGRQAEPAVQSTPASNEPAAQLTKQQVDAIQEAFTLYDTYANPDVYTLLDSVRNIAAGNEQVAGIVDKINSDLDEEGLGDIDMRDEAAEELRRQLQSILLRDLTPKQEAEQITLTDGRVVTPATISRADFAKLGNISPIQRAVIAIKANKAQHPDWGLTTAGFGNDARMLLFDELPSGKNDLKKVEDIYWKTQQEYVAEPNKTEEYRVAADDVLREIWRRLTYLNSDKWPGGQGSALLSRLKDAELAVAEHETDTNPSEAQKKAENYKQGHVTLWGLPITIENPKGSTRRGTDANGKKWEQVMHNTYGKIRRTEGVDGDHIDVFIGPNLSSERVFVVDQLNQDTGEFDEHKVMLGLDSMDEAQTAYLSNYEKGWRGMGPVTEVTMDEFKKWIDSSHRKTKMFSEYKSVKAEAGQSQEQSAPTNEEQLRDELAEELRKYDEGETSPADANLLYDTDDLRTAVTDLLTRYDNPALQAALDAIETSVEQQRARGGWIDVEDEEAVLVQTVRDIVGDKAKAKSRELTLLEAAQQRQRLAQRDNRGISKMSKEDILAELEQYAEGNLLETTPKMAKRILALAKKYGENLPEPIANMVSNMTWLTNQKKAPKKTTKKAEAQQPAEQPKAEPKNTIFTDEAYEAAKARMRARLNHLNMGLDPEMLADQIVIAGYHVERGARKFADFARAVINDFGDGIRQYVKQMYNYLRDIPEGEPYRAEMDDYQTVMAFDIDNFDFKDRMMPAVREYEDVNGQKITITDVSKGRDGTVYYDLTITEPSGHIRQTSLSVDNFNKELESKGIFPANSEKNAQKNAENAENILINQNNLVTLHRERKIQEYRPKELSKENAELWDWLEENVDRIVDDYKAAQGNTLDPDVVREAFREKGYDGSNVQQYRLLEGALVEILYDEMLTEALAQGRTKLVFLTGHGGAGKSTATKQEKGKPKNPVKEQIQSLKDEAGVLFDAAMNDYTKLKKRIQQAIEKGFETENITVVPVYNDAVTPFENTLKRAKNPEGRVLTIKYFLTAFGKNTGKIAKIMEDFPQITIIPVNNKGNNGGQIETPEQATQWNYEITDNDKQSIRKIYEDYVNKGLLTERQIATVRDGLSDLKSAGGRVLPSNEGSGEWVAPTSTEHSVSEQEGTGRAERPEPGSVSGVRGPLNIPTDLEGALAYFRASVGKMYAKTMGEDDIRTITINRVGQGEDYRVQVTNVRKGISTDYTPEARDLANILNNGFEEVPPSGGGTPAPQGPNGGKKATFEKGQKVKYKNKVDGKMYDATVDSVNADGTYNLIAPSPVFGDMFMGNISEDRISPVEEAPKKGSPMMKQFRDIKKQYPDATLLFRVGDFYELYEEDAETASKILGITLIKRKDGRTFAGFPFHALDTYLPKLVRAGKRVAICNQLEAPKKEDKEVKRGVAELVTPGTPYKEQAPKQAEPAQEQPQTAEESATETPTQVVTDTIGEIKESKHTKTGEPIWVIKPLERVGNDEFKVLKRRAKLNNGYYSTFVKGFVFNSENDANRFNNISDEQTTTEQTSADTEAVISTAEATAAEAAAVGESAGEEIKQPVIEKIDAATEQIDDQVATLAGIETQVPEVPELPANATVADIREQAEKRSTRNKQLKKRKEELQQVLDLFADEPINEDDNGNTNQDTEGTSGATEAEPAAVGSDGTQSDGRPQAGTTKEPSGSRDAGVVADGDAGEIGGETQPTAATGSQQSGSKRGGSQRTAGGVSAGTVQLDPTIEHGETRTDDHSLRTPKEKNTPLNTRNYLYPEDAGAIDNMTPSERMLANVEALETLRNLMVEGREATPEERAILGKLRGWGGVNVPDNYQAKYNRLTLTDVQKRLVDVVNQLDPNGERKLLDSLRTASHTSYYTPIPIARAMHAVAMFAGYKGNGNMLDPSMGNGVFEGSMPKGMQQSTNIRGIELDWLTGQIAQRLYPDARINITGFQDAHIPQDYYDYVISNIPFGSLQITDLDWTRNPSPIRKAAQGKIHNYFAVKMIESTRPGGLCVIMTSNAIMDTAGNQLIRDYITDTCEVLGAVRLPNNTFKGAGTKVVTDVIFLRKFRNADDRAKMIDRADYWEDVATPFRYTEKQQLKDKDAATHDVNFSKYYQAHPEYVIGDALAGGQYSGDAYDLESSFTTDELANRIVSLGRKMLDERKQRFGNITIDTTTPRAEIIEKVKEAYKGNGKFESSGNIVIQDGKIGKLENVKEGNTKKLMFAEQKVGSASVAQITDYTNLRSLLKELIHAQIENYTDDRIDDIRKNMQQAYTAYVKKYGKLQDKKNAFIEEDIDGFQVRALEQWKDGKFVGMADIYTKNTIASERDMNNVSDPQAAVLNSLAAYGNINADYLQSVLGDNFAEQCAGLIFEDPAHQGEYIARDVYLSGDVVTKLEYAKAIAAEDSRFQPNVDALEAIQPKRKAFGEFPCHMGARWIPVQIYNDFLNDIFGIHGNWKGQKTGIVYMEATNEYIFNFDAKELGGKAANYATRRKRPQDIFQAALLDKDITVTYKDEDGKDRVDQDETDAARDKVAELREAFEDWIPQNQDRVQQLTDAYNDVFNRHVLPTYNGQHMNIVGLQGMTLRPHQKDAVWRIINQRGGIIDHIVGAGKSLVMQASIMEMRRMGIAKKPMILALKSTTQQIATEFHQAFPAARVLAPTDKDFDVKNRKRFLAQIAVNDYDCIILSHEQYTALDHTEAIKRSFIEEQIAQIDNLLEYLYGQADQTQLTKKQLKGLEKRKENLKEKLKKLELIKTDEEFVFENLGVDYLFVDECQAFKNLMFQTSYNRVAGLGDPAGSDRSTKLLYGIRALQEMHQGDMGTVFLSGTTITNSLSELYNIFNYLRPNEMKRMGLNTFDAWASTFAVRSTEAEFGVTNELKEKSRFRKFEGLQELSRLYTEIADVRNDQNLELPKPKLHTVFVSIPITDTMKRINDAITNMVRNMDGTFFGINPVDKQKYPWSLSATNLAKAATLSPKLIDTSYDDENGKIFNVCENIAKIYKQFNEQKGVQLVFCDSGVPGPGKKYDAYNDIIKRLTKDYGIPRSEIADIHIADNDEKRQELFRKVNDGKVRILIGGTKNMGTGVNVQKRVVAMHHLDIPWTPADVNQRNGRGSRQGNEIARDYNNNQVDAYYYAVERTLDTYRYQLQDVKGRMIENFKMANVGVDEFDEGSDEMSAAEMVAILSGNPVILDKAKQDKIVDKLKRAQRTSLTEYARRRSEYETLQQRQSNMESLIRRNKQDIETLKRNGFEQDEAGNWPPLQVTLTEYERTTSGTTYDKATDAGKAIHDRIKKTGTAYLHAFGISARVVDKVDDQGQTSLSKELEAITYSGIKYSVAMSDDDTAAGQAMQNLLKKIYNNGEVYKRSLEDINHWLDGADPGEYTFPRQAELDAAVAKKREIDAEYNKLVVSDKKPKKTEEPEKQLLNLDYDAELTEAQQLATAALVEVLNDNTDLDVFLATDEEAQDVITTTPDASQVEHPMRSTYNTQGVTGETPEFSIRKEAAPKKTGIGYKVFRRGKDGKLYPPMVANPNGADTPVGVWLNADAAPVAEVSKTGRPKVKSTGSGTLAFRPGWHLGEIPYALQFNRKDENGEKTLFPKDFVWAEVEYAADNDYQDKAMKEGMNPSGKFQHSLAGLKRVPTDGFYRYRTNPNPATDPWIITGAMKVNRILTNEEVDEIVRAAGREPQVREALITADGTLYGWAVGDRIYLTKDGLNPNTPIHEYTHLWAKAMRRNNREGWQSIVNIFKDTPMWEDVKNDPNYAGLTTDDAVCSEVLARYSGTRGAARMEEAAAEMLDKAEQSGSVLGMAKARQLISRVHKALSDFWHWVGTNLFGIKHFDSAEQVADRVLFDLLNQTNLGDLSGENAEAMISGWSPEKQKYISDWHDAHPRPQYQVGESLDHYRERLNAWNAEYKKFSEQLKSWKPTAQATGTADRPTSAGAPAFVEGVRPTPMANETPGEYALRLRQYYQLMRDEKLVAEYVAEINAQADAAAKVLKKNTLVRGLFDAAKPIENFQEWMKERGATVTNESNAYTDTFLATGRVTQANEQMERDIIRPLAKQIGKIIAPDKETGKSRLDGLGIVWQNMDVQGTGTQLDGKALTPREIISVYCQAKDCQEAIDLGLPDRGAAGFRNNLGRSHEDIINMVESVIPKAELDELWRLINKATHFALNYDYESGRISEDTHTQFYQREFYVPQRGWRERDESGLVSEYEPVGKRGNDPYNAALVKARGRKTLASDPFAYIMSIDASSIISSENNKIKQKFLQFCLDNENLGLKTGAFRVKKYWIMNVIDEQTGKVKLDEEGNPMMVVSYVAPSAEDMEHDRTVKDLIKQKRKELTKVSKAFAERQAHGELGPQLEAAYKAKIAKIEQTIDDLEQQMRIAWHATNSNITHRTSDEKKQHEVRVLMDGQEYVIELQDEKLANAINKKFKQHQEELFNTTGRMRNATRFMSAMLTQFNPEFAASNFARDYQVALATLIAEHPELVKPFVKNFAACQPTVWQYAFNDKVFDREGYRDSELGRYLKEYFEAGAATGFSYMQDLKSLRRDFDSMINESNFRRGMKGAVGVFSMLTEVSETAVRFAGYVSARQAGMGVNDAAYLSKELTTNFDRAGEIADSGWMSWFSFFRATLNGNIKFLKALKKMPLAYSLIAASYFAMGMLNQFLNPDDPDDEIWASDYTRQSNFVIWKFRIPTAHFLRMFFAAGVNSAKWLQSEKSFGEATYNTATFATQELLPNYLNVLGNGTDWNSREGRVDFTWEGLLQGVMPSPVSPIADVYFNRDFRGATINREPFAKSQEGTKDILLSKEHTLPVYKWLTQAVYEGVGGNMNTKYQSDDPAWRSWLFDTSASSVEHVVEGYMPAGMDMFITTAEAIYDAATGTPTGPDKWPFIRKFYNAYTPERAYTQQYYLLNGRVKDFERNMKDYLKNDKARYNLLRNSQEYRTYLNTKKLVANEKEQPTTADVNALIEANKQWLRKK